MTKTDTKRFVLVYFSVDQRHDGKVRSFNTAKGAARFIRKWVGEVCLEGTTGISFDGIGKVMCVTGQDLTDILREADSPRHHRPCRWKCDGDKSVCGDCDACCDVIDAYHGDEGQPYIPGSEYIGR